MNSIDLSVKCSGKCGDLGIARIRYEGPFPSRDVLLTIAEHLPPDKRIPGSIPIQGVCYEVSPPTHWLFKPDGKLYCDRCYQ